MSVATCPVCYLDLAEAPPVGITPRADSYPVSNSKDRGRGRSRRPRVGVQIPNSGTEPQSGPGRNRSEIVTTPCGHIFHNVCALEWFLTQTGRRTCPTCNRQCLGWHKLPTVYPLLEPVQNALSENLFAVTAELNDCKMRLADAQETIMNIVRRGLKRDYAAAQLEADAHEARGGGGRNANVPAANPARIDVQEQTPCIIM